MAIQCNNCFHDNPDHIQYCEACGFPLSSQSQSVGYYLPPGTILTNPQNNNQYRIEKTLGEGGFGITYKGIYLKTSLPVAIKENWPGGARNKTQVIWPSSITPQDRQEQLTKFIREGEHIYKCQHPNIVKVYDWFSANNTTYLVMEFLAGKSLESLSRDQGGRLPEFQVKKYLIQVCQGLKVVHSNNLLHRDIKPDNIMLVQSEDKAVLIDFGNAREFIANKTVGMSKILTPGYAPPEQYSFQGRKGPALDIYALCATMYRLLTGLEPPDATERVATLASSGPDPLNSLRQIVPNLDPILDQLILTGMKMNAQERFQSVDEIMDGLRGKLVSPTLKNARQLVKEQKLRDAVTLYQKCINDEQNPTAVVELAMVLIHLDEGQAEPIAEQAIKMSPQDGRGYGVLGLIKCRQSQWLKALAYLEQATKLAPQESWIQANLAWVYGKMGKWDSAEKTIKMAISLDSQSPFALSLQAWICANRKQWKEGNNFATKAISLCKTYPHRHKVFSWLYPCRLLCLQYGVITQNNPCFINQILQELITQVPDSGFADGFKGWKEATQGLWQNAFSDFQQALTKPHTPRWILLNYAIAQEQINNLKGAISSYQLYEQKFPEDNLLWLNINNSLIPDSAFVYFRLGTLFGKDQQWIKAKEYLEKALSLSEEYAEVHHNLGWVLLNIKNSRGQFQYSRELLSAYQSAVKLYQQQQKFNQVQQINHCFQAARVSLN
jgi:serine/threonine protein kinase